MLRWGEGRVVGIEFGGRGRGGAQRCPGEKRLLQVEEMTEFWLLLAVVTPVPPAPSPAYATESFLVLHQANKCSGCFRSGVRRMMDMCRCRGVLLSASRLAVCDNPQLTMDDQDTGPCTISFFVLRLDPRDPTGYST